MININLVLKICEGINSDNYSIDEKDEKLIQNKKEKAESIKPLFEVLYNEKQFLVEQQSKLLDLVENNKHFQQLINLCKENINKMSSVHGHKKTIDMIDENASQNNHAGFNAD